MRVSLVGLFSLPLEEFGGGVEHATSYRYKAVTCLPEPCESGLEEN